jgi:crotonobetaine/carnitine-CoA ligase
LSKKKKFRLGRKTLFRDVVKNYAETLGDKKWLTFIKDFDKGLDETYSYKDMHLLSNRLGNGLLKIGLKKGDGIALMEPNSPEFLFVVFTTFKLGTFTPLVNTSLKGDGLIYILNHSDAKAIIINHAYLETFMKIKDQLKNIKHVIVNLREAPDDFKLPERTISLQEVMEAPDEDIEIEIKLEDMVLLMYTAGTTGLPKAVTFYQGKVVGGNNISTLKAVFGAMLLQGKENVIYTALPLAHANALFISTFTAYLNDVPFILAKRFSASRHFNICRKYNVTEFNTLGAMIPILMKQPERPNDKEHNVKIVLSAACPKEVWEAFINRYNITIREFYAATDGGGFALANFGLVKPRVGSMGKSLGATASILDDDGNLLGPNEVGELVFEWKDREAEQREVKYYKNVEASKKLIRQDKDGKNWFTTGDLAYYDEDGYFFYVDRKRDAIRRRGENIVLKI